MGRPNTQIGQRIKDLRIAAGLTQRTLADLCGVSEPTVVSRWERGLQLPRLDIAAKLATAVGSTLDALVGNEPPGPDATGQRGRARLVAELVLALDDRDVDALVAATRALGRARRRQRSAASE